MMVKKFHNYCFQELLNTVSWQPDRLKIYGKIIETKRKVAWYGDDAFDYSYSKISRLALPWSPILLELKTKTEQATQSKFNSCLLNLYQSFIQCSDNRTMAYSFNVAKV